VGILLQGLCTLVAIAMVHSDNRIACAITLTLFVPRRRLQLMSDYLFVLAVSNVCFIVFNFLNLNAGC